MFEGSRRRKTRPSFELGDELPAVEGVKEIDLFGESHKISGTKAASAKRVSFDDGQSQLASLDYSRSGVSKLTVLQDFDLGYSRI